MPRPGSSSRTTPPGAFRRRSGRGRSCPWLALRSKALCPVAVADVHGRAGAQSRHPRPHTDNGALALARRLGYGAEIYGAYLTSATVTLSTPPFVFASSMSDCEMDFR